MRADDLSMVAVRPRTSPITNSKDIRMFTAAFCQGVDTIFKTYMEPTGFSYQRKLPMYHVDVLNDTSTGFGGTGVQIESTLLARHTQPPLLLISLNNIHYESFRHQSEVMVFCKPQSASSATFFRTNDKSCSIYLFSEQQCGALETRQPAHAPSKPPYEIYHRSTPPRLPYHHHKRLLGVASAYCASQEANNRLTTSRCIRMRQAVDLGIGRGISAGEAERG
jgi:hypothetical protein